MLHEDDTVVKVPLNPPRPPAQIVHIIERTEVPVGIGASLVNAARESFKDALISGGLTSAVGMVLGALDGYSNPQPFINESQTSTGVTLGGQSVFGIAQVPTVTLGPESGVKEALASDPNLTAAGLGAADTALRLGVPAAVVGAGVGAIKGGWVDYITKEREIKAVQKTPQIT